MGEQVKQTGQPALSEEEKKLNRQINYFIMRYMWQVVRGRGGNDTIYTTFNMSRERFTRIIDTGVVRYTKNELSWLVEKTGISQRIFTGEERFRCYSKKKNNQGECPELLSTVDWENLFDLRDKRKEQSSSVSIQNTAVNKAKKKYEREQSAKSEAEVAEHEKELKKQKELHRKIQEQYKEERDIICQRLKDDSKQVNQHFAALYTFLNKEWTLKDELIKECKAALGKVDISTLDECTKVELTNLQQLIEKKARLIDAIITYKTEKRIF